LMKLWNQRFGLEPLKRMLKSGESAMPKPNLSLRKLSAFKNRTKNGKDNRLTQRLSKNAFKRGSISKS